ncbi:pentatricopeptide repeat-containing protein At4g21190 [Andrographis paniculata]|uniref:pentatricopeptide repeat-containing protein At4g21190 n=1 Tax=Andrographis paniculata TaxID=175694 RepID=UPI0021E96005|nr:pentatricopeptide repeat-containing protein At4g21190 [Andrographis paniculata]
MSRIASLPKLVSRINHLNLHKALSQSSSFSTILQSVDIGTVPKRRPQLIGENVSRKDKIGILVTTLNDLPNSKEAVYGTLDAWVAWERDFPIGPLKQVLIRLEKDQQWHRVIQIIKWMLSKGQGTTRGTYGQLIRALDHDRRVEEAHEIWKKKLSYDLHSVPWKLCDLMISVYYRNDMLEDLVKLFKGLESFDRKPPGKSIVQKVANAYEQLGLCEEKDRILEKYKTLFDESPDRKFKKISRARRLKNDDRSTEAEQPSSDGPLEG